MLLDKIHSAVEFQAFLFTNEKEQVHPRKIPIWRRIKGQWFLPILVFPAGNETTLYLWFREKI